MKLLTLHIAVIMSCLLIHTSPAKVNIELEPKPLPIVDKMPTQANVVPIPVVREPVVAREREDIKTYAKRRVNESFGIGQWEAFNTIVYRESSWNPQAVNRSSGACGLPQALPCSKIKDHSEKGQIEWMIQYISGRYGTPKKALAWHNLKGWY